MKVTIKESVSPQINISEKRELCFDCLRIVAAFAVMILHIASQNWYAVEVGTYEWKVFSFYDSIVRWAVPVFVMISGALFLSKDHTIEKIFKKNILRIFTAFLFWSALYAVVNLITGRSELKNALREFVEGPTHLWFLFMISGLYILVPLLRKIVINMELTRYFMVVSLAFTFVLPYMITLLSLYSEKLSSIANGMLKSVCFHFTLGYVGYFVYGYYFSQIIIKGKKKWLIYLLGIAGIMITIFAQVIFPISDKGAVSVFHDNMALNVMFVSIAIFVFARSSLRLVGASDKLKKIVSKLSEYSFGAYLVHVMIISQLNRLFGLNTLSFNPMLSVPVIGVIVFIISFVISGILHQIPVLGKYVS